MRLLDNWWPLVLDFAYAGGMRVGALVQRVASAPGGGELAPVVLVPGVYETWHFMKPIADRLTRLGHPVHFVPELGRNAATIPEAAQTVYRYLEQNDLSGVVLIGHSKGGLIAKHVMVVDDTAGRVDRMIALASPFSGSSYARYMPSRPLRAFIPTAEPLATLAADARANSRITSIYPVFDGHIPEGSALAGATNVEVPVKGHFRVLADPRSIDAVVEALGVERS
jgi:pimeloyl-ACP methyl ester carboxylesterase